MTVEERAQLMVEEDRVYWWEGTEEVKARYARRLRDQIEECAKKADYYCQNGEIGYANCIAEQIRALAEPTAQKEKDDDR